MFPIIVTFLSELSIVNVPLCFTEQLVPKLIHLYDVLTDACTVITFTLRGLAVAQLCFNR